MEIKVDILYNSVSSLNNRSIKEIFHKLTYLVGVQHKKYNLHIIADGLKSLITNKKDFNYQSFKTTPGNLDQLSFVATTFINSCQII